MSGRNIKKLVTLAILVKSLETLSMLAERMDSDIVGLLLPGEDVLLVASQSKFAPGGSISSQDKIYVTTQRILFKDPKMFGARADILAIRYDEIATVMLKRGIFSTEILLKPRLSVQRINLPAVDKKIALKLSLLVQKGMRAELDGQSAQNKMMDAGTQYTERKKVNEDGGDVCGTANFFDRQKQQQQQHHKPATMNKARQNTTNQPNASYESKMISGTLLDDKENKTFLDGSDRTGSLRAKPSPQDDPTTIDASTTSSSDISNPITDPLQTENNSENLITCRYCGFTAVPALAKFCMDCGKALKTDTNIWKMCPLCDAMATNDAVFCTQCKQKFPQSLA